MDAEAKSNNIRENQEPSLKEVLKELRDWFKYLVSKWHFILIAGLVGGGLGFLYSQIRTPVYTATTTFVLEEDGGAGGGGGGFNGLASLVGIDLGSSNGIFQGDNIFELYKSRLMIEKTLLTEVNIDGKKELLIDRYVDFNKLRDKWAKDPNFSDLSFSPDLKRDADAKKLRLKDSVLNAIVVDIRKNNLNVDKQDKKLSIIKVELKSEDEKFAKHFNDEIVDNVNEFYILTKTKKSIDNINILQAKTDSIRKVMTGAIFSAAAISDATPNLNESRQTRRNAPIQQSQYSAETNKLVLTELLKNLEISKISLKKESPLIQLIDSPIYPLSVDKLGKAKAIVIGGFLGGFLICLVLIVKRLMRIILA